MGMVELVLIPANNGQMLMLSNDGVRAGVRVKCQSKELEKLESESSARVFTLALDSDPGSVGSGPLRFIGACNDLTA